MHHNTHIRVRVRPVKIGITKKTKVLRKKEKSLCYWNRLFGGIDFSIPDVEFISEIDSIVPWAWSTWIKMSRCPRNVMLKRWERESGSPESAAAPWPVCLPQPSFLSFWFPNRFSPRTSIEKIDFLSRANYYLSSFFTLAWEVPSSERL